MMIASPASITVASQPYFLIELSKAEILVELRSPE
jgi:hypothetical protein